MAFWRRVFWPFRVDPVLVVATVVATTDRILAVLKALPRHRRIGATRAGVIRNVAAFESLWKASHVGRHIRVNDLEAWELEPR
jgi:hypothetical protein